MKTTFTRRIRRKSSSSKEGSMFKKEGRQEHIFFGEQPAQDTFFRPTASIHRKCEKCEEDDKKVHRMTDTKDEEKKLQPAEEKKDEDKKLQKKETGAQSSPGNVTSGFLNSINGQGQPLSKKAQTFFAGRMGHNFSRVKIHNDKRAAESAKEVNAKAYTIGNNIVFNEGQYNDETVEGQKLIAHELVHVMQQGNGSQLPNLQRKSDDEETEPQAETLTEPEMPLPQIKLEGEGSETTNTTHNANCNGVSVSGSTTANYSNSFSSSGTPTRATTCQACTAPECITINGNVVSIFATNPVVALPSVPSGLNVCEQAAVRNFINTTLSQHEQQHVAAFNTYRGRVTTPYNFTGCSGDLQAYVQNIHDGIESSRRAASDAASAALDANGANNFTITCNCPAPQADAGTP